MRLSEKKIIKLIDYDSSFSTDLSVISVLLLKFKCPHIELPDAPKCTYSLYTSILITSVSYCTLQKNPKFHNHIFSQKVFLLLI